MVSSIKEWSLDVYSRPLELVIGLAIFAAAVGGGAVAHVASTSLIVLLLTAIAYVRSWSLLYHQLSSAERLVLFCFSLYFFSAALSYYSVNDEYEYFKHIERYFRFVLIIPIYLLLSKTDLKLFRYLLAGAVISGPLYLSIAYLSLADNAGINAKGGYHHITFGDMAMLNSLFMAAVLLISKTSKKMKLVLVVSIMCLLYASILSQARGAWLALPFCLLFLLPLAVHHGKIKIQTIFIVLIILSGLIAASPAKKILIDRVQEAAHEVELFQTGDNRVTSIGARLAMWHIALNTWKKHPVVGTGPGDFGLEIKESHEQGLYKKLPLFSSTHNIFFQALATTGTIGLVVLCLALFIIPFRLFYNISREKLNVASVSGMVVLIAFSVFGLTESWILRSPPLSIYLLYYVTLATSAIKMAKTND